MDNVVEMYAVPEPNPGVFFPVEFHKIQREIPENPSEVSQT